MPSRGIELAEIEAALMPERRANWRVGWARAHQLGAVAVAPLWARLEDSQADYRRRLLFLSAVGVAGGATSYERVASLLSRPSSGREHHRGQFIALLLLAMGDSRETDCPPLRTLLSRASLAPQLQVAGCLALRRLPGVEIDLPARWYRSSDPGVAAAVRLAREGGTDRTLASWFRRLDAEAGLVRRAAFVATVAGRFDRDLALRLRDALGNRGLGTADVRAAAALSLSHAEDLGGWLERGELPIDAEIVPILARTPQSRAALRARGLLDPPPDRLDPATRARTILAYVLACDRQDLLRASRNWRSDDDAAIAHLGVAWRFARDPESADESWIDVLPPHPYREWVRVACGQLGESTSPSPEPRVSLDAALIAVREGRLSLSAAVDEIEAELWRRNAHLERARYDIEGALVRDLLVAGSTYGASVLGRPSDAYLPKGLSAGDTTYEVAFELWRFLSEPGRRPPASVRLR